MAAPLNPPSTQPHCWCPGGDPGSGGAVWCATGWSLLWGQGQQGFSYLLGPQGHVWQAALCCCPGKEQHVPFCCVLLTAGHQIPLRKMDGLLASVLLLQVPACHLPPFPPSSLSLSASWVLSSCAVQESCEAPCATQAPMFLQPQHSRCSKREQGVWWSAVFCNGGVLEGILSEDADSLAGACCKPPPAQAYVCWKLPPASPAALPGPPAWDGCGWQGSFHFTKVKMFSNSFLLPKEYLSSFCLGYLGQTCRKKHTKVVLGSCY